MSSDSSFPRPPSKPAAQPRDEASSREPEGARVIELSEPSAGAEASRSSERPLPLQRRRENGGQVVAFPGQQRTQKRRRAEAPAEAPAEREPSGAQPAEAPAATEADVERPRYLASELLRQDWYPRAPLARSIRIGALALGALGAAAVLRLDASSTGAHILAGVLGLSAVLGALPLRAEVRGAGVGLLGLAGTAVAGWLATGDGEAPAAPLLVACVTLSASALFFRAAHRTARFARALVGVGLATTGAWLVLTGGLDALVIESLDWRDWVFPALRLLLGLVALGALLTFLDPTGHGGAWVAGAAFLVWLALKTVARIAVAAWPASGEGALALSDPMWLATVVSPLLAALTAGGLCQLWVLVSRPPKGKREAPTRATMG